MSALDFSVVCSDVNYQHCIRVTGLKNKKGMNLNVSITRERLRLSSPNCSQR